MSKTFDILHNQNFDGTRSPLDGAVVIATFYETENEVTSRITALRKAFGYAVYSPKVFFREVSGKKSLDAPDDATKIKCVCEAVQLIEEKRRIAALLDPNNAPMPMTGSVARMYQQGKADAYQYALEMLNATWFGWKYG